MKKILLISAALCLCASSAFAVGADLTYSGCPGGAGTSTGTIDCAGGEQITLIGTFQPAEAMTDLVAADCILDINFNPGTDPNTNASFWDLGTANSLSLGISQVMPTCAGYTKTWNVSGAGSGAAAAIQAGQSGPRTRVATTCYRPTLISVAANAKLFGFVVTIDGTTSIEDTTDGGTLPGCSSPVGVVLQQVLPITQSGSQTTLLTTGSLALNTVLLNGATLVTPTTRHSWGQLKSLYR